MFSTGKNGHRCISWRLHFVHSWCRKQLVWWKKESLSDLCEPSHFLDTKLIKSAVFWHLTNSWPSSPRYFLKVQSLLERSSQRGSAPWLLRPLFRGSSLIRTQHNSRSSSTWAKLIRSDLTWKRSRNQWRAIHHFVKTWLAFLCAFVMRSLGYRLPGTMHRTAHKGIN